MELTSRLNQVTAERDLLQETVRSGQGARGKKEESRWESQCQRQEERIIELHSVIAELSRKMEETRDDMIKEESEVESNLDNQSIATDSFVDEKLRYRDEFEDYTSLAFERDLEFHTSLGRAKARTAASLSEDRTSERSAESGSCSYTKQLELQVVELLGLKDQLAQERLGREQLELQLGLKEKELGAARQQVASLVLERDTYKRQISDLKSTVEYQEAKMESKAATKEPFLSRFAERRSLRKKKGDKKEGKERVASPLECEAQGIISSFAKLNMKVCTVCSMKASAVMLKVLITASCTTGSKNHLLL